jgi:hypothetical protein
MAYTQIFAVGPSQAGASTAQNTFTTVRGLVVGSSGAVWNTAQYPATAPGLTAGTTISIRAWGVFSGTGTPTVILGLYRGTINDPVTTSPEILAVSTAKTMTTTAATWEWDCWYQGRVVKTGTVTTGGSIIGTGYWRFGTSLTAWTEVRWPETAPAEVAIDTTISKGLAIGWTWSASSASNTVTCHDMQVDVRPPV